jgi:hypothetical protein
MEDRRAFLRLAVFGLASGALGTGVAQATHPAPTDPPRASSPSGPWWLLHPITPGAELGLGWRIIHVFPPISGAVTLNLAHEDGRVARVDLSLREGAARGPAASHYIDFIVMDGADGASPMDESLGRVLRRLAAVVGENEERDLDSLAALLPHSERVWRHADALSAASTRMSPA